MNAIDIVPKCRVVMETLICVSYIFLMVSLLKPTSAGVRGRKEKHAKLYMNMPW